MEYFFSYLWGWSGNKSTTSAHLQQQTKQTRWFLVRKQTIPTEVPPLVGEF
jgi:hypothetical protein